MSKTSMLALIVLLIGLVVVSSSIYVIDEREVGIKFQFGEIVESNLAPGIHFKLPIMQNVKKFDARVLTLDTRPERFLTVGKKFVIVDSFIKWKIIDVKAYYKATAGNRFQATNLLSNSMNKGLRDEFASRTLTEVVSGERDQLMAKISETLNLQTQGEFGIEVVDVRVKGIDLPEDLNKNVYRRMSTEREREARETRSQGKELAEGKAVDDILMGLIKDFYNGAKRVVFNGDGYGQEWQDEAAKRGLPNLKTSADALKVIQDTKANEFLTKLGIYSADELETRFNVRVERYVLHREIEFRTLINMVNKDILPAAINFKTEIANSINAQKQAGVEAKVDLEILKGINIAVEAVASTVNKLETSLNKNSGNHSIEYATIIAKELLPMSEEIAHEISYLEENISDELWPLPTYFDMLFVK